MLGFLIPLRRADSELRWEQHLAALFFQLLVTGNSDLDKKAIEALY